MRAEWDEWDEPTQVGETADAARTGVVPAPRPAQRPRPASAPSTPRNASASALGDPCGAL